MSQTPVYIVWFQNRRAKWRKAERLKEEQRKREEQGGVKKDADGKDDKQLDDMLTRSSSDAGCDDSDMLRECPSRSSGRGSPEPARSATEAIPSGTSSPHSPAPSLSSEPTKVVAPSFAQHMFSFSDSAAGFRPVIDGNATSRNTPPLFFPPHLASHISSQFSPPLFPGLKGFPGLCSCCPIKPITSMASFSVSDPSTSPDNDHRSSSVAELRRKAQEHSAALLQSLQHVANFQQAAGLAGGLSFPLLPPLTLQAFQRKQDTPENVNSSSKEHA